MSFPQINSPKITNITDIRDLFGPICGWPSGWLGILEFAPPKVSGSIPSGANFGGLSPYRACSGFKRPPQVGSGVGPLGLVGP